MTVEPTKVCKGWGQELSVSDFLNQKGTHDGLRPKCQPCRYLDKSARTKEKRRRLQAHKTFEGCAKCRFAEHPAALDFHHVDEDTKSYHVSNMVSNDYGWAAIMAEVEKCVVLCANCHRIEHTTND